MGDLYYPAVGGDWTTFSGTITLWYSFDINMQVTGINVPAYTVTFVNGQATGTQPGGPGAGVNNGFYAAKWLEQQNPQRLDGLGGQVQIATGAEATSRTLFTFSGARNWSFVLNYNSSTARLQGKYDYSTTGHGWDHNFATKLVAGTVPEVRWSPTSISKFDVVIDANTYGCTQDNARYDTLVHQTNGQWLLTHVDQSALLFDSSGNLIEDLDPQGRKLVLTYTTNRLTLIRDPVSGTQLTLGYISGMLRTLTDAESKSMSLNYAVTTEYRLLTSIINQNNKTTTFGYGTAVEKRQLETLTDHNNLVLTTNIFDAYGRVTSQDDAVSGNHLMEFAYEEEGTPGNVFYAPSDTGHTIPIYLPTTGELPSRVNTATNSAGQTITYAYDATSGRLLTATLGTQVTTLGYDAAGNLATITDPASVTTPLVARYITRVTDRNDKEWVYTFDANRNLLSVDDPLNNTTSYVYDDKNHVTSITDANNHTRSFTYWPANGLLDTATDAEGKETAYTYDSHNNLNTITDPNSNITDFNFDTDNTLLSVTDARGKTTTWDYTINWPFPDTMTLPEGGVVHYNEYTAGRLTQMTDPNGVITKFQYFTNGQLEWREDHAGKRTLYDYDNVGNLRHVTTPDPDSTATGAGKDQYVTEFQYDHRNRLLKTIAPDGGETTNEYDDNGNLHKVFNAYTKVTTYDYDGEDRLWKITSPDPDSTATGVGKDPLITEYHYDDAGRLDWIKDPAGKQTTFTPDDAGRLDYVDDPLNHRLDYGYNDRGLPETITDPLLHVTELKYDSQGRLYTSTDPLKRKTTFDRDELGRAYKVTDPANLVSEQGFDDDGNLATLKNSAGVSHTFGYTNGRLSGETTPVGHATGYGYNTRGLLETITKPSTEATTLLYDDAQLLKSRTDTLSAITYGRDAGGRINTIVEGAKTITRVYNLLGQLESFTDGDGNVIGYLYDEAARLKKVTYPGTSTKEVHYTYDEAGRLHTVKDWENRLTTYTYYDDGRLKETLRQNNTKQLREYDAAGRLEHLKEYAPGGTTILYAGDYRYDAANQLIGETINPAIAPTFFTHSQTFDADNRLVTHNGESVTIDADGNLTNIAAGVSPENYSYDVRNRLQTAGALTYTYDAENRRVAQTDGANTTTYIINPNAALDQVLMKTVGGVTTFYVYGLGLLHEETGGVVRYYHFDRRGDTIALTNSGGTVTGSATYGVFGELNSQTGTLDTPFLFNGRWGVQTDANGIYYHRARYYHPSLRRFLNQDVMLGSITNGASLNRFAYANGNPVSMIDPFGLMAQDPDANGLTLNSIWNGFVSLQEANPLIGQNTMLLRTVMGFDFLRWQEVGTTQRVIEGSALALSFVPAARMLARGESLLAAENIAERSFSITKRGWQGYPSNPTIPKPEGPFRLLQGAEKDAARNAANNANRAAHRADPSLAGKQIHEIQPVKFGGSPTDSANKIPLTTQEHTPFTTWWRQLQRDLE